MESEAYISLKHLKKGETRIEEHGYAQEVNSHKYEFEPNDVLFGKLRPIFRKVVLADFEGICSTDINVFEPVEGVSRHFLLYTLFREEFIQYADKTSTGTRMPRADWDELDELLVAVPPIQEQDAMGNLLAALDDRGVENSTILEKSEEMVEILFKYLFVDFGPYSKFQETEIGKLPEKFDLKTLSEVLSLQRGYSYKGENTNEEGNGIPMVNLGNISPGGGFTGSNMKYFTGTAKERYKISPGELVISHTDMTQDADILGSPLVVPDFGANEMIFSHHLYKIVDSDLPTEYLYPYFLSEYFKQTAESYASGTTVLSFSSSITEDTYIPVPDEDSLEAYLSASEPLFKMVELKRQESATLSELRNTILPKLLSGEIRLPT